MPILYQHLAFILLLFSSNIIIGCNQHPEDVTPSKPYSSGKKIHTKQLDYIFYTKRAGAVGGRPWKQQTVYLHNDGTVIISVEDTHGTLTELKTGASDTVALFKNIGHWLSSPFPSASKKMKPNQSLETSEYYPASMTLRYRYLNDHQPIIVEQPYDQIAPPITHIIKAITSFIKKSVTLKPSVSATYGRIALAPNPDKYFIAPDLIRNQLTANALNLIQPLLKRPMALTYLDTNKRKFFLGANKHLSVNKPIYLKINKSILLLRAFVLTTNHQ